MALFYLLQDSMVPSYKKGQIMDKIYPDADVYQPLSVYVEDIAAKLDIRVPENIKYVPYIFSDSTNQLKISYDIMPDYATQKYNGYYLPEDNFGNKDVILIATYDPHTHKPRSVINVVFTIAHELRHVWQRQKFYNIYFSENNATGNETINDLSEVNADAYAYAYLKYVQGISDEKIMQDENVKNFFTMDGGLRFDEVKKFRNYCFKDR